MPDVVKLVTRLSDKSWLLYLMLNQLHSSLSIEKQELVLNCTKHIFTVMMKVHLNRNVLTSIG